jgi:hypothetical protein
MMPLLCVQEMLMLLEEPFAMQWGAEDKQAVEDQMPQIRLDGLMRRKGQQQLVEQLRKGMLQLQEGGDARKWKGQLDPQI